MNTNQSNQPQTLITPNTQPSNTSSSTQISSTSKKKTPWVLISLVVLLFSSTGALGYKYYQVKQQLLQPSTSSKSSLANIVEYQKTDEYKVVLKANLKDSSTDVFIDDLTTGKQDFFISLTDIDALNSHGSEYSNGNLYIVRKVEHNNQNWFNELWKYNPEKTGVKLYSGKSIDFSIAPNGNYIAINDDRSKLTIIDQNGVILQSYTTTELGMDDDLWLQIYFFGWSNDSEQFWGQLASSAPRTIFKINIRSSQIDKYDVNNLIGWNEYKLNVNNGKVVYSNSFSVYNSFVYEEKNKGEYTLTIYDLETKKQEQIDSFFITKDAYKPDLQLDPVWVDNNTIEYTNIKINERVRKTI